MRYNNPLPQTWTKRRRMKVAMTGGRPDRVPVMPQIDTQHGVQYTEPDYRKGIAAAYENPWMFLERTMAIAETFDYDGIRLGVPDDPVRVKDEGEYLVAYDIETSRRIGVTDMAGGAKILPDEPKDIVEDADDLRRTPRPRADELLAGRSYQMLRKAVEQAGERFFVASWAVAPTVSYVLARRGEQRGLVDLLENRDLCERLMDVGLEIAVENARALGQCGVDALNIGEAYCSCSVITPDIFAEMCVPRLRTFVSEIHAAGVLAYLHICGNSRPILEMMADTGVDCIEPLDPLGGVEVADAKRRVGRRVGLMGGVNTLTMRNGSPRDVLAEAGRCCRDAGPDGGYILAAGDMVPNFTPRENLSAFVQAGKDHCYAEG